MRIVLAASSYGPHLIRATGCDADEGEEAWIDEPARLYADAIARQVRRWLAEAPVMATTGRPLSPGDILILVRSRAELASLIVARLYAQGCRWPGSTGCTCTSRWQ